MDRRRFKEPIPEKSRLPQEYQEVEYLECTGSQYIKTSFIMYQNCDGFDAKLLETNYGNGYVIAAEDYNYIQMYASTHRISMINGRATTINYGIGDTYVEPFTFGFFDNENDGYRIYKNDNLIASGSYSTNTVQYPLYICASNLKGKATGFLKDVALYNIKFYNLDNIVCNLIPCYRKTDHKTGMYDLVNNVFYTNEGTSEFIIGPEVKPDCDLPGELGPDNPLKAKFIGYKKIGDTETDNWKLVNRLWDYKEGCYNTNTGEFIKYVEDGLVFHLDARDFDGNQWTEKINGFVFNNGTIAPTKSDDGGVEFNTGHEYLYTDKTFDCSKFTNPTIEVCIDDQNTGNFNVFVNGSNNSIVFAVYDDVIMNANYAFNRGLNTYRDKFGKGVYSMSIGITDDFLRLYNKEVLPRLLNQTWYVAYNAPNMIIGARASSSYEFKGKIYSIRIYNRKLTIDEALNNQKVDNIRFNLGIE